MDWDDDIVLQSKNKSRHEEVVHQMIEAGTAYRCFLSKEELDDLRKKSEEKKELFRVPKTYRDCSLDIIFKRNISTHCLPISIKCTPNQVSLAINNR